MPAYLQVHLRTKYGEEDKTFGGHVGVSLIDENSQRRFFELTVATNNPLVALGGSKDVLILENQNGRYHDKDYSWQDSALIKLTDNQRLAVEGYLSHMSTAAKNGELRYQAFNLPDTINCTGFVNEVLDAAGVKHSSPAFNPMAVPDALGKDNLSDRVLAGTLGLSNTLRDAMPSNPGAKLAELGDAALARIRGILAESDPNKPMDPASGTTPLMAAVRLGYNDVAHGLLERGADPKARNVDGHTAADLARSPEMKAILEGAIREARQPNARDFER